MKVRIIISHSDHQFILKETYVESQAFGLGIVDGKNIKFDLTEDDIEYIHGYIAAAANHSDSIKTQKRLDGILVYFQKILGF